MRHNYVIFLNFVIFVNLSNYNKLLTYLKLCVKINLMAKILRKIPATMATQHPDHGQKPFWHSHSLIPTVEEARECFLSYNDLNIEEYMWDWEGKLVDESVMERLVAKHFKYFQKNQIGKQKFLTFRLPNPKVQEEFRVSRAIMGILTAAGLARQLNLHSPPLFEVILPMTESAEEIIAIQEAFDEMACLRHPLNRMENNCDMFLELIPLFETVKTIIHSSDILEKYLTLYRHAFKKTPVYLRPFVARSDPALNSGLVPTVLAIKIALSRYSKFEKKHKLKLFPVIGVGSLPFRGGLSPFYTEDFVTEYSGVKTATIQSAFRYDYKKPLVKNAVSFLNKTLPRKKAKLIAPSEERDLIALLHYFEKPYQESIEHIAPIINEVSGYIPKRRERVQHIGLFGYSRGVGKVKLPRAISFTGALYSLGIPPELIGTGRGLAQIKKLGRQKLLEKYYLNFKKDLIKAGGFLYKPGLEALAKKHLAFREIWNDVQEIEKYLIDELGPKTTEEKAHYKLCEKLHLQLKTKKPLTHIIERQAVLRHSMG
jgi:phosphoenolpyruvate carboxylase